MKVRPIDANAILLIVEKIKENKSIPKNYGTLLDISREIRKLPTLDYEPVVYAHWKTEGKSDYLIQRRCSNCNGMLTQGTEQEKSPFCCHCGAKMDEEVKG